MAKVGYSIGGLVAKMKYTIAKLMASAGEPLPVKQANLADLHPLRTSREVQLGHSTTIKSGTTKFY